MTVRSLTLLVCTLAVGCGGSSGSRSSNSTAPGATGTTSGSTSSSTTAPTTSSVTPPPPPPPPANYQPVAFETVEVGSMSQIQVAQETQVATDVDWASFWPTHSSAPLPSVDFASESVVGTFMGSQRSGGFATQIVNVSRDTNSQDLRLLVREAPPGDWRPVPSVLTSPFHLVRAATVVTGQGNLTVNRQTQLDFEPLAAGSNNALGTGNPNYAGGIHVLRDAAAYNALFFQVDPTRRPPAINFTTTMVVAILGPSIPRFGNSIQALRLLHDATSNEIRLIRRVNPYRGGAAPPPAIEEPWVFLRVTPAPGTLRDEITTAVTQTPLRSGRSTVYRGRAETLLIRDATTLANVWLTHVGGRAPAVDFSQDQVVFSIEAAGSIATRTVARSVLLEDDELSVTINSNSLPRPTPGTSYSAVTTPRTFGPIRTETIDTTPRP